MIQTCYIRLVLQCVRHLSQIFGLHLHIKKRTPKSPLFRINDSREAFNDAVIDQGIDPGLRGHAGQPNLLSQIRVRDSSVLAEDRDDFAVRIINQGGAFSPEE